MEQGKVQGHQKELADQVERFTRFDATHETDIPFLQMMRASQNSAPIHSVYSSSLCFVAQGAKMAMLGKENYHYDPTSFLVTSVHLPIASKIIEASPERPFLGVKIYFSADDILDIIKESNSSWGKGGESERGIFIGQSTSLLYDAIMRLVRLLDAPDEIPVLAPLIKREIIYRVLQDEKGDWIKTIFNSGSHAHAISKVIQLIKRDYDKPLRIDRLAREANLSASALHKHFKKITSMSPLQYQKRIRLQEARSLLISESLEAIDAGFRVGYESPSQFNREYARMFGLPPIKDAKQMREVSIPSTL
ncbi:AraC family transcriptional regulator N-terminal domain-containing protein [Salibacterium aidingense]|uniref:AraC family transcriptional regulator N-terminal domain-containing protein n=1 Tax=Salibacterium aidingense TaxID=384933 RepID=UPI003BBEE7DD